MRLLGFFHLRSISGQIAALVVVSILALHLIITAGFLITRPDRATAPPDSEHEFVTAARLLSAAGAGERPRLLAVSCRETIRCPSHGFNLCPA